MCNTPAQSRVNLELAAQCLVHVGSEDGVYRLNEQAVTVFDHTHSGLCFILMLK